MTPQRWQQTKSVLAGAMELRTAERDAFIASGGPDGGS